MNIFHRYEPKEGEATEKDQKTGRPGDQETSGDQEKDQKTGRPGDQETSGDQEKDQR